MAQNVHLLKMPQMESLCDYVIIATATSGPHLDALERYLRRELKGLGLVLGKPVEGRSSGSWRIVDAGFAVIHMMDEASRKRYNLEHIWSETEIVPFLQRKKSSKRRAKKAAGSY